MTIGMSKKCAAVITLHYELCRGSMCLVCTSEFMSMLNRGALMLRWTSKRERERDSLRGI